MDYFSNLRRPEQKKSPKRELTTFIEEQINDNIKSETMKEAADILRENRNDIILFISECFKKAPKNALVNYIWNSVLHQSKFIKVTYLLAKIAEKLEYQRDSIFIMSDEELQERKRKVERVMATRQQIQEKSQEKEKERFEPPAKKRMSDVDDSRPIHPKFIPPGSVFDGHGPGPSRGPPKSLAPQIADPSLLSQISSESSQNRTETLLSSTNFDTGDSAAGSSKSSSSSKSNCRHNSGNKSTSAAQTRQQYNEINKRKAEKEKNSKEYKLVDIECMRNMEGPNPTGTIVSFPNCLQECRYPAYQNLETWISTHDYEDEIKDAFHAFRNSCYNSSVVAAPLKRPQNLFIFDSMPTSFVFEVIFDKVKCIECSFPNAPSFINEFLKNEIEKQRNDYEIKNVFVNVGLDFITLEPDCDTALKHASNFYKNFLKLLISAFHPDGPKRYAHDTESSEVVKIIPPNVTFINIPQVQPLNGAINQKIIRMNDSINSFVNEWKESKEKDKISVEYFDWAAASSKFLDCSEIHLWKRNRKLMIYLQEKRGFSLRS